MSEKNILSDSVGYFLEIFINLWYDYVIDKPYAVVNQNNLTFKNPKMCSTSLIISISSVRSITEID